MPFIFRVSALIFASAFFAGCFIEQPGAKLSGAKSSGAIVVHTGSMLVACAPCHSAKRPTALINQFDHSVPAAQSDCVTCHLDNAGTTWTRAKFDHALNTATTSCFVCHKNQVPAGIIHKMNHAAAYFDPANSPTKSGTALSIDLQGSCFKCHTAPAGPVQPSVIVPSTDWTTGTSGKLHANVSASAMNACAACHAPAPSGSVGSPSFNHSTSGGSGDCFFCHGAPTTSIGVSWANGQFAHSPTPTSCSSCHLANRPTGPVGPIGAQFDHATSGGTGDCVFCHTSIAANIGVTWAGGSFSHSPTPASCASCHITALPNPIDTLVSLSSKTPPGDQYQHIAAFNGTNDCKSCHASQIGTTWRAGFYDHNANTVATCIPCHNNDRLPPGVLIPGGFDHANGGMGDCVSCHNDRGGAWAGGNFSHSPVPTTCSTCHSTAVELAKSKYGSTTPTSKVPVGTTADVFVHVSTYNGTADCKGCHAANIGTSFTGGKFLGHANNLGVQVSSGCDYCHTGNRPVGPTASGYDHSPNGLGDCIQCHTNVGGSWTGAGSDHSKFTSTSDCLACHATARPAATTYLPAGVTKNRYLHASGYNGASPVNCVPCHMASIPNNTTVHWTGGFYNHTSNGTSGVSSCFPCHQLETPGTVGSPNIFAHSTTAADCGSCHTNPGTATPTATKWAGGNYVHPSTLSACASCHSAGVDIAGGGSAIIPAAASNDQFQHITSFNGTSDCYTCHKKAVPASPSMTDWSGGVYNHTTNGSTSVTSCFPCHQKFAPGTVGSPTPFNHSSTTADCGSCHKAPSSATTAPTLANWAGGTYTHTTSLTSCTSCHTLAAAVPGGANAIVPALATNDQFQHLSAFNGTNDCNTCHRASLPAATAWSGGVFNHTTNGSTSVTTCFPCHQKFNPGTAGGYTHANPSPDCASCHKAPSNTLTSPAMTNWAGAAVDHTGLTTCASCHEVNRPTTWSGTNYAGALVTYSGHFTGQDCGNCHLGKSTSVTTWAAGFQHKNAAGKLFLTAPVVACLTCHADDRPAASRTGTAHGIYGSYTGECNACHNLTTRWGGTLTTGSTDWVRTYDSTIAISHSGMTSATTCSNCHQAGLPPAGWINKNSIVPPHSTPQECGFCHQYAAGRAFNITSTTHYNQSGTVYRPATGAAGLPVKTMSECKNCH